MSQTDIQLQLLNEILQQARNCELYAKKLRRYTQKLNNISELKNLPFTKKQDLRDFYPFGVLAVPIKDVVEIHTSSGTTGRATLSYFTEEDLKASTEAIAGAWRCFGINDESRVQFMMSYGLFSGAALNTYAIQSIGGFVVPAGILPAERQVEMMIDLGVDTIIGTPGYYFYLFDYIQGKGIPLKSFSLKRGIAAGEVYSEKTRSEIEQRFKIKIFDHYGLCEVNTGIAFECDHRNGLHILDEYVIPEIINPETGEVLPNESYGELVLTTLKKKASPVIRYRTGDITAIKSGQCPCGRDSIRIERIKRRTDDLLFIKGIKIDPYELRELVLEIAGSKIYSDIKIRISSSFERQTPEILVSLKDSSDTDSLANIRKAIKNKTLLTFEVKHVDRSYFQRGENNKVKFVEYVN